MAPGREHFQVLKASKFLRSNRTQVCWDWLFPCLHSWVLGVTGPRGMVPGLWHTRMWLLCQKDRLAPVETKVSFSGVAAAFPLPQDWAGHASYPWPLHSRRQRCLGCVCQGNWIHFPPEWTSGHAMSLKSSSCCKLLKQIQQVLRSHRLFKFDRTWDPILVWTVYFVEEKIWA